SRDFLAFLTLEQKVAALLTQVHQRLQNVARHRQAVGVFEVVAAIARQAARTGAQRLQKFDQGVVGRPLVGIAAYTDQLRELLAGKPQLVSLDPEEVADALEVVRGGPALAAEVFVELPAVDGQLSAYLRNGAVMAAQQLEIGAEVVRHAVFR